MKNKKKKSGFTVQEEKLIEEIKMKVTRNDLKLLKQVEKMSRQRCVRGVHHLCSGFLGKTGEVYYGLQQTYRRAADLETCAEITAQGNLQFAEDICVTVATCHFFPMVEREDGGVLNLMPPCTRCGNRIFHQEQRQGAEIGVLVFHNGEVIKIPPKYTPLFTYPVGYTNK